MNKDYRSNEICPYCGKKLKHKPRYEEDIGGIFVEVEYGLLCEKCGTIDYYAYGNWDIDYYAYGNWDGDIGMQMMEVEHE